MYSEMYPINKNTVTLVLSFYMGWVSQQFHVSFDTLFTTINGRNGNLVPTRYWHAMCGFIKRKKSIFLHSKQHDSSSKYISTKYQIHTNSDNNPEPEENASVQPV